MVFIKKTLKYAVITFILMIVVALIIPEEWLEESESETKTEIKTEAPSTEESNNKGVSIDKSEYEPPLGAFEPEEYQTATIEPLLKIGIEEFSGMKVKKLVKKLGEPKLKGSNYTYDQYNTGFDIVDGRVSAMYINKTHTFSNEAEGQEMWGERYQVDLKENINYSGKEEDIYEILDMLDIKPKKDMEIEYAVPGGFSVNNVNKKITLVMLSYWPESGGWKMRIRFE